MKKNLKEKKSYHKIGLSVNRPLSVLPIRQKFDHSRPISHDSRTEVKIDYFPKNYYLDVAEID